nr:hypothetical protein [Tanacetum cinerariifolium]
MSIGAERRGNGRVQGENNSFLGKYEHWSGKAWKWKGA